MRSTGALSFLPVSGLASSPKASNTFLLNRLFNVTSHPNPSSYEATSQNIPCSFSSRLSWVPVMTWLFYWSRFSSFTVYLFLLPGFSLYYKQRSQIKKGSCYYNWGQRACVSQHPKCRWFVAYNWIVRLLNLNAVFSRWLTMAEQLEMSECIRYKIFHCIPFKNGTVWRKQ